MVNFFQTTCIPCRQEHPELVKFQETYAPVGSPRSCRSCSTTPAMSGLLRRVRRRLALVAENAAPITVVDYGVPLVPGAVVAPTGWSVTKLPGASAGSISKRSSPAA
ncbi:MAG: hypothetical protein R2695_04820 [Acidimicrobiales bacterium]